MTHYSRSGPMTEEDKMDDRGFLRSSYLTTYLTIFGDVRGWGNALLQHHVISVVERN